MRRRRGKSKNLKEDLGTSWWAGPKDPSLADTGLTTAPQVHLGAGGHTWHFRTWPPHFQENPPPSSKEGSLQAGMIWGQPGTRAATQTLSLHLGPSSAAGVLLRVAGDYVPIVPVLHTSPRPTSGALNCTTCLCYCALGLSVPMEMAPGPSWGRGTH